MAHAAIKGRGTLIALRLLLGVTESGFTQLAFYYMSLMYPKFSLGLRMGLFSGMYSVAGAFAGLIAYGLLHLDSKHLHGWQTVFLFEGALTVLVALIAWALLPSDVGSAWFLNSTERAHAVRRMERDLADAQEVGGYDEEGNPVTGPDHNKVVTRDILDVVTDWKKMLTIVCNILAVLVSNCPESSITSTVANS
jgi:MFS family permease